MCGDIIVRSREMDIEHAMDGELRSVSSRDDQLMEYVLELIWVNKLI